MADVNLFVSVTRVLLGLPDLLVSDGDTYLAPQFMGGAVSWDRQQVSSRWVDGDYTTSRRRGNVVEQLGVEVKADSEARLKAMMAELIEAFTQDNYQLNVNYGGSLTVYQCEAADYINAMWTTPRLAAFQGQITFSVPRRPVAIAGL